MRICFVTAGSLADYENRAAEADIVCCGYQAIGQVSYERELKGETALFEDVAQLSKAGKNVVVCGCFTDARGIKRKSVVVAERGKILGVTDMVNRIDTAEFRPGAGIKIFDTFAGKLGIIVAEDLYFPRVIETLSVCGAEVALCMFEQLNDSLEQTLMRSEAFLFGIPVCLCAYGYAQCADIAGKVRFASPKSPCVFELEQEREYHLVETRQRGFFLKEKTGY